MGNFVFYLLMVCGPLVSFSSSNWLICWAGIELSFMGLVPLLISEGKMAPTLGTESTMKYFCLQAAGSGLLMLGGVLVIMAPLTTSIFSYLTFLVGLLLKLGIFPLHFWVPSVVAGLTWYSLFLVLTWQKAVPFVLMMNLVENCETLTYILLILSGISAVVGAFIGLNQTKLKPMLGASSITHSAWVAIASVSGSFWFYFIIYCFSLILLLIYLDKKENFLSGVMIISMSGLPPFIMFVGKWSVLKHALTLSESWWFLICPLVGSIMSLFFYLKFFYSFYMESSLSTSLKLISISSLVLISMLGAMFVVMF